MDNITITKDGIIISINDIIFDIFLFPLNTNNKIRDIGINNKINGLKGRNLVFNAKIKVMKDKIIVSTERIMFLIKSFFNIVTSYLLIYIIY